MDVSKIVFLFCFGVCTMVPVSKVYRVQNNTMGVKIGAMDIDKVDFTPSMKITTKEELITWATYAMRIMASKINITLASTDEDIPSERIEKLRNSSATINQFLENMNKEEKKRTENAKPTKTLPMMVTKHINTKESKTLSNCGKLEKNFLKLLSATEQPDFKEQNNFELFSGRPMKQDNASPFFKGHFDSKLPYYSFRKYNMQEVAIINPHDHPDHEIFRDPHIFPPFNVNHPQKIYLPLPLEHKPTYNEENLKKYYALINQDNITEAAKQDTYVRQNAQGSSQLTPVRNNNFTTTKMSHPIDTKLDAFNHSAMDIVYRPKNIETSSTIRPVIAIPFGAYITIMRESYTPEAASLSSSLKSGPEQHTVSSTINYGQSKSPKFRDSRYEASTRDIPKLLPNSVINHNQHLQKEKDTSNPANNLNVETSASKFGEEKERKQKQIYKKQPSALHLLFRILTLLNTNGSTPTASNVVTQISKKLPTSKHMQLFPFKRSYRGKRNETSEEQINSREGGNNKNVNVNKDVDSNDGRSQDEKGEPDIFDDDDDNGSNSNDDYDYNDEGGGSLGSIEDLIPLIIPILEDISDPESDTDLGEFLAAGVPLLQGLSEAFTRKIMVT